jgi:hypothetical protein
MFQYASYHTAMLKTVKKEAIFEVILERTP